MESDGGGVGIGGGVVGREDGSVDDVVVEIVTLPLDGDEVMIDEEIRRLWDRVEGGVGDDSYDSRR